MADHATLIRRYVDDVLNGPKPAAAARQILTGDFLFLGPGNRDGLRGPEQFAAFQELMRTALADLRFELRDSIAVGDRAALVLRMTGVHRGTFAGVEPRGALVDLALVDIVRFAGDRIAEVTAYMDAADLRRQMEAGAP